MKKIHVTKKRETLKGDSQICQVYSTVAIAISHIISQRFSIKCYTLWNALLVILSMLSDSKWVGNYHVLHFRDVDNATQRGRGPHPWWQSRCIVHPKFTHCPVSGSQTHPRVQDYTATPSLNSLSPFLFRTATGLDATMKIVLGACILLYLEMEFLCAQEQVCNTASSFLLFSGNGKTSPGLNIGLSWSGHIFLIPQV